MKFTPLETAGFTLSEFESSDIPDLVRICSSPKVNEFLFQVPVPYTDVDANEFVKLAKKQWKSGVKLRWAVRSKVSGENSPVLACVEIRYDQGYDSIGIWVDPNMHSKGIAYESIVAAVRFAREINYTKSGLIGYCHHVDNTKSQKLAKRLGLTFVAKFNTAQFDVKNRDGEYYNYLAYEFPDDSLLNDDHFGAMPVHNHK